MNKLSAKKTSPRLSKKTVKRACLLQMGGTPIVYFGMVRLLDAMHDKGLSYETSNIYYVLGLSLLSLITILSWDRDYEGKVGRKNIATAYYKEMLVINNLISAVYIFCTAVFHDMNVLPAIFCFGIIAAAWSLATIPASALIYFANDDIALKKENAAIKEKERLSKIVTARTIVSRKVWVGVGALQFLVICLSFLFLSVFLQTEYYLSGSGNLGATIALIEVSILGLLVGIPVWKGLKYNLNKKESAIRWFKVIMSLEVVWFLFLTNLALDDPQYSGASGLIAAGIYFTFVFLMGTGICSSILYFMPGVKVSLAEAKEQKLRREQGANVIYSTLWDNFVGFEDAPVKLYGQDKTELAIAKAIKSYEEDDGKPLSLLFCGASGVGKTQMVENLAVANNMPFLQFNMPEYGGGTSTKGGDIAKDKLLGMPAGYIDSERGGLLTNSLIKFPTAIFLFDEMEKASPSVYDIFLNALDKGFIDDARGTRVDCSKATFIFTTNIGRDVDPELEDAKIRDKMVREGFRPELVGRLHKAIVFHPLSEKIAGMIAKHELQRAMKKMAVRYEMSAPKVTWSPEKLALRASIGTSGYEKYGVRVIAKTMKELAVDILNEYQAKKGKKGVVIYPTKHGIPNRSALKGALPFAVGVGQSIDTAVLFKAITQNVKGQDHAVSSIIDQIKLREMGLVAKKEQPEGTYLFTGPSGTGKTELVKQLASNLDRKFVFFNMGNFKGENGIEAFFGPPPGYVGSDDGGQLTNAILDNPDAIILLDEIEKANPMIWDAFMSVFDDGIAKDNSTGEIVSFKNTMIFMTSNLVTEDIPQSQIRDYLRGTDYFRPEMINRIENIVSFKPLGDEVKGDIVAKILGKVLENYNKTNGTNIQAKEEWLARFTAMSDFTNGARDIQRMIQKELAKELI